MKEACEFLMDFLVEDRPGRLVTCPSLSPENTYLLPDGRKARLCAGPAMDSQIADAMLDWTAQAAEILAIDADFRAAAQATRRGLPPPAIGKHGQLQEWAEDYDEAEPGHRHISHLWALHPGWAISPHRTPDLAAAARVTLQRRLAHGGGHTGWSRGVDHQLLGAAAGRRAGRGERAGPPRQQHAAQPAGQPPAVPDRRQLRRHGRDRRDAAPESPRRASPAAGVAQGLARRPRDGPAGPRRV